MQKARDLPVLHPGSSVEHDDLPLLLAEGGEHRLQYQPVVAGEGHPVGKLGLPILRRHGHRPLPLPHALQRQVAGDGQHPRHRFSLGLVGRCSAAYLEIGVLQYVLGILGVSAQGQRKAVYSGMGLPVQPGQGLPVSFRDSRDVIVQHVASAPGKRNRREE